jgi:adenine-specific DNA-methyltransferase
MNYLIQGDNLLVLQIIKNKNFVDLIYIDPPYNTGKKILKYNDFFKSHQDWVAFIQPRLKLSLPIMKDSGLIFISIGDQEHAHLKILCNEIFGEKNFISNICWQSHHSVFNDKNGITSQIEYILVYAKNKKLATINKDALDLDYVKSKYKNPDNDPRGYWRTIQLWKQKNPISYTVTSPTGIKWTKPWNFTEKSWQTKLVEKNLLYWGDNLDKCPVKKVFLRDTKGKGIRNLWLGEEVGWSADGGNTLQDLVGRRNDFIYPKPVSLIKRILKIAATKDSLVMDYFAGSGTTGQAVIEMNKEDGGNRQFILVTNNENNICEEVTYPRLLKVGGDFKYIKDLNDIEI